MIQLTTELKQEHNVLLLMIKDIKDNGISTKKGLIKLLESKQILIDHLTKEDKQLYPLLIKRAKRDRYLKSLLYNLSIDMDELTKTALAFYDKYEKMNPENYDEKEFGKEISMIMIKLSARISLENRKLYPEYDKLTQVRFFALKNFFNFLRRDPEVELNN